MIDRQIDRIIKVGKFQHIHASYEEGTVYCKPLEFFKKCEKEDARFDKSEGAVNIEQVTKIWLKSDTGYDITFSRTPEKGETKLRSAYKYDHPTELFGNIFCCTAVFENDYEEFQNLDPRFAEFGDTILLIEKPMKFIKALEQCLKDNKRGYKMDLINYYDRNEYHGELDFFSKPNEYSFENELRLFIENTIDENLILKLPPLKEYSSLWVLKDVLNLNK